MTVLKEELENGQLNSGISTGNTGVQGPTSGSSRITPPSSGSPGVSQSSGRFTNLKKYVEANKGAGEQLGGRITSGLEKETTKATDSSQASQIAANVKAEQDRINQGENFNARIKKDEARDIYGNADEKTQFQNLYNNVNNVSNLTNEMNTAQQNQIDAIRQAQGNVSNLGSEQGRFQLLQNTIRSPNYTRGQQRLDQLTLQAGNPQALAAAQKNLGQQIKTSANDLSKTYQDIGTNIGTASSRANEVSNMLKGTVNKTTEDLTNAQKTIAEQAQLDNVKMNDSLMKILNGTASESDYTKAGHLLTNAGITGDTRTYNLLTDGKYNNYYSEGQKNIYAQDVINADDFARYKALRGLSGQELTDFTGVGGGYTTTGLKGDLLGDAKAADAAFRSAIDKMGRSAGNLDNDYTYGGKSSRYTDAAVRANANLLNLLTNEEAGRDLGKAYDLYGHEGSILKDVDVTDNGMWGKNTSERTYGYNPKDVSTLQDLLNNSGGRSNWSETQSAIAGDTQKRVDNILKQLEDEKRTAGYNNTFSGLKK